MKDQCSLIHSWSLAPPAPAGRHTANQRPAPVGAPVDADGRRRVITTVFLLMGLLLIACSAAVDAGAPPTIQYGQDTCTASGMIIDEPAHAAAYRTASGEVRLFDSVGAMVRYHREHREAVTAFFVHDYQTASWLRAESAHYVLSGGLRTPMGIGVVALGSEEAARAVAGQVAGRTVAWPFLIDQAVLPEGKPHGHA